MALLLFPLFSVIMVISLSFGSLSNPPENIQIVKNLIKNPGFEETSLSRRLPHYWKKASGDNQSILMLDSPGYKSQSSISIIGSGEWSTEVEGIKTNTYYLLSFWVYRDGWRDGEYPFVNLFNQDIYMNELFFWGGWRRVSYILNSGNNKQTVLKFYITGASHKIKFDDVSLKEFKIVPLAPREGAIFKGREVRFEWMTPEDDRVFSIYLELSRSRDLKNRKVYRLFSPMGRNFDLKEALDNGRWYWQLSMYHNQILLTHSDIQSFTVSLPLSSNIKGLDEGGLKPAVKNPSSITENKPLFFPIGIYGARIEAFEELKKAGFNLVQNYNSDTDFINRFVKKAGEHDLRALCTITTPSKMPDLPNFINNIKKNPGLYGWYIADEPEGRGIPPSYLWRLSYYIHSIDPEHPTTLVNVRSKKVVDYASAVDIVMVDPYPIPHMPVTWLSDSIEEARDAVKDEKPIWAVIQAFNWASFSEEFANGIGRYPTYDEERCLTYLSIVHGAKGVVYFSYAAAQKDDPELKNWGNIKSIVSELREIYPLLLIQNSKERLSLKVVEPSEINDYKSFENRNEARDVTGNPAIHYVIKKVTPGLEGLNLLKDGIYIIAVNVTDKEVNALFSGPSLSGSVANVLFEDRVLKITNKRLIEKFDPYEVHIYYIGSIDK